MSSISDLVLSIETWRGITSVENRCSGDLPMSDQHTMSGQSLLVRTAFGDMFRDDSLIRLNLPVYDIYGANTENIS